MRQPQSGILTSSLPLQIFFHYHYYFLWLFYVLEILSFIYKSVKLPYPSSIFSWEIAALCFLFVVDFARLFLGSKGNKTQAETLLAFCLFLSIPTILGNVFFFQWQTYVVRLEYIINVIALVFSVIECVLMPLTAWAFWRNRS